MTGERSDLPSRDEVYASVDAALSAFLDHEASLISSDPSERSLTHRLAVHLETAFPGWDVDCEFNRDGDFPKKIKGFADQLVEIASPEAVTVFPDIVVHRRGKAGPNLLVIEGKKATSRRGPELDHLKLRAYKDELGYKFAAFIVLPAGERPGRQTEWI